MSLSARTGDRARCQPLDPNRDSPDQRTHMRFYWSNPDRPAAPLVTLHPLPASRNSEPTGSIKTAWDCFVWAVRGREKFSIAPYRGAIIPDDLLALIEEGLAQTKMFFVFNPDNLPLLKTADTAVKSFSRHGQSLASTTSEEPTGHDVAARFFEMAGFMAMMVDEHEALQCLAQSVSLKPLNTSAARVLALLYRRHESHDSAKGVLDQLIAALENERAVVQRELDCMPANWARDDDRIGKIDRDINAAVADLRGRLH